jgi:prepilin-type N-terminal cleavage/methylation domain-containing protein
MRLTRYTRQRGFTIIEILITTFIIGTVVTGLFGLFLLNMRINREAERRVIGLALANERAELIRNLPYLDVGTVGGIPAGDLPTTLVVTRNTVPFTVKTDIRYVDDPFDGLVTGAPSDLLNTDYKQVRIEVSWPTPLATPPLTLLMQVAPAGIEGGEAAGTLIFQALNAGGQGVSDATVQVVNDTVDPAIDITTETDNDGRVILPGLPESASTYELTVSKSGFTGEQTYDVTAGFTPDVDHSHLSALAGEVTSKTFFIDAVSSLTLTTQTTNGTALGGVPYSLRGTKTIGTDASAEPVYVVDVSQSTNPGGTATQADLVWDTYTLLIDGAASGYDIKETSSVLPLVINPAETHAVTVTLVDHQPHSLRVTVVDPLGAPVSGAAVRLFGLGYDHTLNTPSSGQVYFSDDPATLLSSDGDYALEVQAAGFDLFEQTVSVAGTTHTTAVLTPTP